MPIRLVQPYKMSSPSPLLKRLKTTVVSVGVQTEALKTLKTVTTGNSTAH